MIGITSQASAGKSEEQAPPLAEQLEALELALKGLHACGRALVMAPRSVFDLRPAGAACERAIVAALDAYDGRREVVTSLTEAAAAADELGAEIGRAVETDPGLEPAADWAKTAAGWLRKALASPSSGRLPIPSPLVASMELPSLHRPARQTLHPVLVIAPPVAPPPAAPLPVDPSLPPAERLALVKARAKERQAAAEERRAAREAKRAEGTKRALVEEPPPGFVAGKHRALTIDEAIVERGRRCFEDVAALGMMRAPQLGEEWRTMATIDARLLAGVDAIVGLGPAALGAIERFVVDAPAKDPTRGFAAALIGGSLEGRDGLAVLERCAAFLGMQETENARAVADGLALAPSPDVPVLLRRWLLEEEPAYRAIAIDVLTRRGEATKVEISRALVDDAPEVIAAALIPAALARVPELAGRAEELLTHTSGEVTAGLAWALVLGEVPFAVSRLRDWLGTPREEHALLPVALAGERDDVEGIEKLADKKMSKARIAALGYGGAVSSVTLLLRVLREGKDDELKLAAAFALLRLTDAPLFDDTTIAPEKIDVPEPDEPDDPSPARASVAKRISDPRDLPSDGSPDRAVLPSVDPARWESWLAEREPYPEQLRLRRGKAYTPALSLLELADYAVTPFERTVLYRELVLKTGDALPFDVRDFVKVQAARLDAWAEPARRGSSQPGSWGRARRRG